MEDKYSSSPDWQLGKDVKRVRLNPVGEDIYLNPDGSISRDEDKIVRAQQIFKHNYYKPDGRGASKILSKY
jgi:hypothetical protein